MKTNGTIKRILHRQTIWTLALLLFATHCMRASVALLMEDPYGEFGAFNPTGHAAMYMSNICPETPTRLRLCHDGEYGSVISRYHKVHGYDWVAIPLIPYLYAVDSLAEVPQAVSPADVVRLRDAYRRARLEEVAPDAPGGKTPAGEWTQLVGSSYDRTIHGFQVKTTREQDERFIAYVNDEKNVGHFNLFFHNCADFSRVALDIYFPHAVHRNYIADVGITTPKQVARALVKYGKKNPELNLTAFEIPQASGTMPRSHSIDGVTESLVKSKKYIIPLVVLSPEVSGAIVVAYLSDGRHSPPNGAKIFQIDDAEVQDVPLEQQQPLGRKPLAKP